MTFLLFRVIALVHPEKAGNLISTFNSEMIYHIYDASIYLWQLYFLKARRSFVPGANANMTELEMLDWVDLNLKCTKLF